MTEEQIQNFWRTRPRCATELVSEGQAPQEIVIDTLLRDRDRTRYSECPQLLRHLNGLVLERKRVLEIGVGDGAHSEQLIRRGAIWSGFDSERAALEQAARRFQLRRLPYEALDAGSPADLPYESGSFDLVFSHCFLSRVRDIQGVQYEIARVLKPQGELITVLYARWSLHRFFSYVAPRAVNAPVSTEFVYDARKIRRTFSAFDVKSASKMFLDAPGVPVSLLQSLPGTALFGWWIWVHLERRS